MSSFTSKLPVAVLLLFLQPDYCRLVECGGSLVKVFNKLRSADINLTFHSVQQSVQVLSLGPESSGSYTALSGNSFWNVTVQSTQSTVKFGAFEFKSDHQYGLVIQNKSNVYDLFVLDVTVPGTRGKKTSLEQASVVISSNVTDDLELFGVTVNCYKSDNLSYTLPSNFEYRIFEAGADVGWIAKLQWWCNPQSLGTIHAAKSFDLTVDARWKYRLLIEGQDGGKCSYVYHFQEGWHYQLMVTRNPTNKMECVLRTKKTAPNPYIPIAAMFGIYIALILLYHFVSYLWCRLQSKEGRLSRLLSKNCNTESPKENQAAPPQGKARLRSLDTFRGVAITLMIFVNYGGGGYYFFEHSIWNGLTVADLVFPWFIYIMGTSILLSQKRVLASGGPRFGFFWKIVIRSSKLFLIGFFLSVTGDLSVKRVPGVLQRFAISYFVVATANLFFSPRGPQGEEEDRSKWYHFFRDIFTFWIQWLIMLGIIFIYLAVTFLMNVPGCPRGYLGPGGIGDEGKYPRCTGGAAGYIDRWFFTENHIYNFPTCKEIYQTTEAYDPEGMLGSLTSIFLTFLGLQAGRILVYYNTHENRIARWMAWGLVLGIVAMGLSGGTKNEGVIPINKNLWSVSFIFATGSLAYILLTFLYVVIDFKHWWDGGPFFFAGMNAIFLYCGHEVFHKFFPFNFVTHPPTHASLLARAAVGTSLWVIISYYMYCQKIFFKV